MSGRELAEEVSESRIDVGLVEGEPVGAEVTEFAYDVLRIHGESLGSNASKEGSLVFEPLRVREVMQRDKAVHSSAPDFVEQ
jgi:hypothetical protein